MIIIRRKISERIYWTSAAHSWCCQNIVLALVWNFDVFGFFHKMYLFIFWFAVENTAMQPNKPLNQNLKPTSHSSMINTSPAENVQPFLQNLSFYYFIRMFDKFFSFICTKSCLRLRHACRFALETDFGIGTGLQYAQLTSLCLINTQLY